MRPREKKDSGRQTRQVFVTPLAFFGGTLPSSREYRVPNFNKPIGEMFKARGASVGSVSPKDIIAQILANDPSLTTVELTGG